METLYERVLRYEKEGIDAVLVTAVAKEGEGPVAIGKKMLVSEKDESIGTVGGGSLELYARKRVKDILKTRISTLEKYLLNDNEVVKADDAKRLNMVCGGKVSLFYEFIGAKEHIYLFGAGHVSQALATVLKTMPFHLVVIDERDFVIKQFKGADRLIHQGFVEFIDSEGLKPGSFVVVCTPNHANDYHVMNKIIEDQIQLKYMGMLSSPDKLKDYLDKTYEKFGKAINLKDFYSPVGLNLGGGSPEEIAISITAEILAISNGKTQLQHMRENVYDQYRYWED